MSFYFVSKNSQLKGGEVFLFHAKIDYGMKEIPSCKDNFDKYAYVYGGIPREERGVHSGSINSTVIWIFKETFMDLCARNI